MTYTLDIKRKKIGVLKGILMVLGLMFAILAVTFIAWLIGGRFRFSVYIPYAFGLALAVFVYYRYILEYRVILRAGRVYVCRLSGDREKPLWDAAAKDFIYFGTVEGAPQVEKYKRFVLGQNALPVRMAVTGKAGAVCFQADEELERLIQEARNAEEPKEAEEDKSTETSSG